MFLFVPVQVWRSVSEANPYLDPLYGIKGWLLLYLIGPMGLNCFWLLTSMQQFRATDMMILFAGLLFFNVVGLILMFVEKPWVRTYHLVYTSIIGGVLLASGALMFSVPGLVFGVIMALWAGYWFRSKRVARTYQVANATG